MCQILNLRLVTAQSIYNVLSARDNLDCGAFLPRDALWCKERYGGIVIACRPSVHPFVCLSVFNSPYFAKGAFYDHSYY